MPDLHLETYIDSPIEIVFDLARSIDLHLLSLDHTGEKAIAGITSGLIDKGQTVTWRAKHLGVTQELTSLITDVEPYYFLADEMVSGAFHSFRHEHYFKTLENGQTFMRDMFSYKSPLGILGMLADKLFLTSYMTRLLEQRNVTIKQVAEDGRWKKLPGMDHHLS